MRARTCTRRATGSETSPSYRPLCAAVASCNDVGWPRWEAASAGSLVDLSPISQGSFVTDVARLYPVPASNAYAYAYAYAYADRVSGLRGPSFAAQQTRELVAADVQRAGRRRLV